MTVIIGRRKLLAALGGAAAAWPLAARAQQPAQIKRVGMLMGFANDALGQVSVKAFQQELERLGWAEGRSVAFEFRWAEGRSERFADFAAEFVRLRVDVILTTATPSTAAAMQATSKNSDRLCGVRRPGWKRLGYEPRAAGRQRHRPFEPEPGCRQQTSRAFTRDCAWAAAIGGHAQSWQSRPDAGNARSSGGGPHDGP